MAELAAGAVSSLLGVIRNEALLLRGVRDDVQFIKEEMESMKSFLAHLARWAPPGGDHDEQVRTWMNQVRLLAQDCNNCIDLYLYRRNPDIHRTRGGLRRYLWWVSWFLHKLVAQHRAAVHLRQLKDRARDVGERRLRYGVEVPAKSVAGQSSSARAAAPGGYAAGDDEEDGDDQLVVATATDHSGPRAFIRPRTLDDYVEAKLLEWYEVFPANAEESMSIVIMAPDTYCDGVLALAHETLVFPPGGFDDERDGYDRVVMVDVPAVHHYFLPLRAEEVLYYILRELELEHSKSQTQEQGTDQGEGEEEDLDSWQVYRRKCVIYEEKNRAIHKIKVNIEEMKIYEKLDKIKSDIRVRPQTLDQLLQLYLEQKKGLDQLDLDVLLQLLLQSAAAASQQDQVKNKDMHKLPAWDDNIIAKIAKKLEEHMEADEKAKKLKEQMGVEEKEETAKHMKEEEGEGGERAEGEGAGGEEEIAKHMEEEEGEEKTAKHMEEEEETAKHMDEEGGGGGEETVKHMEKKGEGAGEVKEEETAKHMEEEEEEGAGEGEEEEKEETTKHMEKEEGAREGGGGGGGEEKEETAKHMEEEEGGRGEGEEKEETAEHMKKEEGGGRGEKEKTAKHMEEEKGEGGGGGKEKAKHMEEEEGEGEEKKETSKYMEEEEGEGAREEGEEEEKEEEIAKHMEEKEGEGEKAEEEEVAKKQKTPIRLHETQYVHILREVFPKTSSSEPLRVQQQDRSLAKQATMATTTTLGEDQIKQMIHDAKQEILRELQEGKYENNQATGQPGVPGQNPEAVFEEIEQKMDKLKQEFKEQLKIKGLVDEIKHHLKDDCPLIILKVDEMMDVSRWEDIRNALSLLKCSADLLIVTTTKGTQQAKEYCYPRREPIDYSLAGLYHDTVLELTSQQKNEDNYNPQIFRDILEECEPHEFCMKIFTHALHANPKRSNEELLKLHSTLQALPKSFNIIANKMFKFSYNDLPKEYKSCLLYLAIFPPGHKIRRSTLIGRWVTEGLTFKEDWPSSVRQANRCFDALIHRWLVYPADIGATGEVKSCVVGDLVHGFITTIARKQHIVETRLSRHLARHFSIFNDLQLRSSDKIDKFFQRLSESPRVSLLKVLDLEGCQCFGRKNQRYLKDICSKMLLLKYLSLRGTNMTQLPNEINYLRELEVLDIRQTKVPAYATVNVLLLKLKRLLAGHIDTSPSNSDTVRSDAGGASPLIPWCSLCVAVCSCGLPSVLQAAY
ncbi:uncharacterized protein LOC133915000 [Phragmites australis]|uniref:uncharacterized protein LOC133915000 n=1 Tax=Phragmites australis TaxID=29695 RepID=UPI002D798060|nr:uncharacterized protein LOC133915000 [Phragmites australis]